MNPSKTDFSVFVVAMLSAPPIPVPRDDAPKEEDWSEERDEKFTDLAAPGTLA